MSDKLKIDLAKVDECALLHDGIHIHNLRYASDALTDYRKNNPPPTGVKNLRVKVKTIHTSIAEVYVYLEAESRYLEVPCVDQDYASGLTLLQHETNKRFVRNYIRAQTDTEHLAEARVYLHERTQQEVAEVAKLLKRMSRQSGGLKKLARYHDIGSDNEKSLASVASQQLTMKEEVPNAGEDVWEDYQPSKDAY
jgi:putative transposase